MTSFSVELWLSCFNDSSIHLAWRPVAFVRAGKPSRRWPRHELGQRFQFRADESNGHAGEHDERCGFLSVGESLLTDRMERLGVDCQPVVANYKDGFAGDELLPGAPGRIENL